MPHYSKELRDAELAIKLLSKNCCDDCHGTIQYAGDVDITVHKRSCSMFNTNNGAKPERRNAIHRLHEPTTTINDIEYAREMMSRDLAQFKERYNPLAESDPGDFDYASSPDLQYRLHKNREDLYRLIRISANGLLRELDEGIKYCEEARKGISEAARQLGLRSTDD